jgi:hypothetical protein
MCPPQGWDVWGGGISSFDGTADILLASIAQSTIGCPITDPIAAGTDPKAAGDRHWPSGVESAANPVILLSVHLRKHRAENERRLSLRESSVFHFFAERKATLKDRTMLTRWR